MPKQIGIFNGDREDLLNALGEGFHTAFRKGLDSPRAHPIHRAISNLPPDEWAAVLEYVVWGLEESDYLEWEDNA